MAVIAGILYAVAFAIALTVQNIDNAAAHAWPVFMGFSVILLLFTGKHRFILTPFTVCLFTFSILLTIHVFLFKPVLGGPQWYMAFTACPLIVLAIMRDDGVEILNWFIRFTGLVLACYACLLLWEWYKWPVEHMSFGRPAWPLINPNNAGTLMMIGFLASLNKKHWLSILFGLALLATSSRGALIASIIGAGVLFIRHWKYILPMAGAGVGAVLYFPTAFTSFLSRVPIWEATLKIIKHFPLTGTGMSMFPIYYAQVKTETGTQGMFAHNDILQLAATLGIPMALLFTLTWLMFIKADRPSAIMAGALVHSMVCFPLYVPAIQLLLGLTVAYAVLRRNTTMVRVLHPEAQKTALGALGN